MKHSKIIISILCLVTVAYLTACQPITISTSAEKSTNESFVTGNSGSNFNSDSSTSTLKTYIVEFEGSGGVLTSGEDIQNTEEEKKVVAPIYEKIGYEFIGWFKESNYINEWNFNIDTVKSNITLYAKWAKLYDLVIEITGNGNVTGSKTYAEGSNVTVVAQADDQYDFKGWYVDGIIKSTAISYTFVMPSKKLTIEAVFEYGGAENNYENYYLSLFEGDWNKPGLYEKNGNPHQTPKQFVSTGKTINVVSHGANGSNAEFDNTEAFKKAIVAASTGDTIYVPNGSYYFKTAATTNGNYTTHIDISKSNITFQGESKTKTILISEFPESLNGTSSGSQSSVIMVLNKSNVVIKDLTISSVEQNLPDINDSKNNNTYYKAPKNGIAIDCNNASSISSNIVVDNVIVERYRRMGIRIARSKDVTVMNSTFQNAIDLGGGGAGYGVVIQGKDNTTNLTDTNQDPLFNIVKNNTFKGPYLRHGVLIQYYAHNNLATNNTFHDILLDSIDLHGELEYSNEISFNTIYNTRAGAGIGVGNTGATHSSAGKNNFLYKNVIDGGLRGIDVIQGSRQTIILENQIMNLTATNSTGIHVNHGPETKILGNALTNINNGTKSYGIKIDYADTPNPDDGLPFNLTIVGNAFTTLQRGIYIEVQGIGFIYLNNIFHLVSIYDFLDDTNNFKG